MVMTMSQAAFGALLLLLAAERGVELWLSRRNARIALAAGGFEVGREHFRWMVALHASFLPAAWTEVVLLQRPWIAALSVSMLGVLLAAQGLRYWAIATLGEQWNVRVILVPGRRLLASGPYAYVRHPNYVAVVLEGAAIPLVHTAWMTALIFTVLNLGVLFARVRCEEEALRNHCNDDAGVGLQPRFFPRLRHGPFGGHRESR
jgi:methyltransferase